MLTNNSFVLGLDLGGTKMALATADLNGVILHREELPTRADQGAHQAVARILQAARDLVAKMQTRSRTTLAGVGVASMGLTLENRVLMAPNVPGWEYLALPPLLQEAFPTAVVQIENDVKAATRAEIRWGALAGIDVGIYVNWGTGIAAGIVIDGKVFHGTHGAAGEIAYNLRSPSEKHGARQGHAPLEEFVGGGAIAARVRQRFGEECNVANVLYRAEHDPEARALVQTVLDEATFHLTNLVIAIDPARVVLGGGLMQAGNLILPHLAEKLERFVPFPPELITARFTRDASLMGAIALALDATWGSKDE